MDVTFVTSNCFSAWPSRRRVANQLFLKNKDVRAYSEIDFRIFDIPDLHNTELSVSEDFVAQLRNTNNPQLFYTYSVSSIIQERFQRAQKYFFRFVMWPFLVYLIIFNAWLHFIYIQDQAMGTTMPLKLVEPARLLEHRDF